MSIILPTFNRAYVLRRTLDSIRAQTLVDWELLVLDDGSSDDTESLVRSYADPRFRYLRNDKNMGHSPTLKRGVREARGEFLAFQDAGEFWAPEKLELQVDRMRRSPPSVGLVYCDYTVEFLDGTESDVKVPVFHAGDKDTADRGLSLGAFGIDTPTWLVRKQVFEVCGAQDVELSRWVDVELLMRVTQSFDLEHIDRSLVRCYERREGVSKNADSLVRAFEHIMKKYPDLTARQRACHYRYVGRRLMPTRHSAMGCALLWKAARPPFGRPADWLWLLLSFGGKPLYDALRALRDFLRRMRSRSGGAPNRIKIQSGTM